MLAVWPRRQHGRMVDHQAIIETTGNGNPMTVMQEPHRDIPPDKMPPRKPPPDVIPLDPEEEPDRPPRGPAIDDPRPDAGSLHIGGQSSLG